MIGTEEWFKRWAAPLCVAGLGVGAIIGAGLWRFSDYPELAASRVITAPTVTVTTTPPLGDLSALSPVTVEKTATVERTVTKTPEPQRVLQAVVPRAETRTVEAEASTVTVTKTETETEEADDDGDDRTRGNSGR